MPTPITTRAGKGQPLEWSEVDGNFIALRDAVDVPHRELLLALRNYYVRTDGSDSNDGLSNTAGGAFLTIQKAIDVVATLDKALFGVDIIVAPGTYVGNIEVTDNDNGTYSGSRAISLSGDFDDPSTTVIQGRLYLINCDRTYVEGFTITNDLWLFNRSQAFAVRVKARAFMASSQSVLALAASTVTGVQSSFGCGIGTYYQSTIAAYYTYVEGSPAFTTGFARANSGSTISFYDPPSGGTPTGPRYTVTGNAFIQAQGNGETWLPGDAPGTTSSGGFYRGTVNKSAEVINAAQGVIFPTSDPGISGAWWDNAGVLTKSP